MSASICSAVGWRLGCPTGKTARENASPARKPVSSCCCRTAPCSCTLSFANSCSENAGVRSCSARSDTSNGRSLRRHRPRICSVLVSTENESAAPTLPSLWAMANLSCAVVPLSSIAPVSVASMTLPGGLRSSPAGSEPTRVTTSRTLVGSAITSMPPMSARTASPATEACATEASRNEAHAMNAAMNLMWATRMVGRPFISLLPLLRASPG